MKRHIRLMALLCMALILITGTKMAEASTKLILQDFPQDTAYIEAVDVLTDLGILRGDNSGELNLDSTITRAEAATVICRLLGVEERAKMRTDSIFADVPSTHWAVGYVAEMVKLGIINGYGNGTFGPSDPVTQQQMLKMLVCAWGYGYDAEDLGGWPNGYARAAESLGIIEDADFIANVAASRSIVAEWAYNILYIDSYVEG